MILKLYYHKFLLIIAFQGDGERSFPQFAAHIEQGNLEENLQSIKGLIYKRNGDCFLNPADNIKKLDELSFPAWDLMPPAKYDSLFCKNPPTASIQISRGLYSQMFVLH